MMLNLDEILTRLEDNRETLHKFGVVRIGIFGSFVRGDANQDSDIDFLVELNPKTFDNYMELKFYLEEIFDRQVDLVLQESIKPRLRSAIEKEVVYAA